MVNSRSRSLLGSQRRASAVVKASSWVQAVRSPARATRAHQIRFCARSCSGRLASPVSFALRHAVLAAGSAPVPQLEVGQLTSRAAGGGVGRKRGDPVAVDVGDPQLSAGMGPFLADDDPHPGRPAGQVEQAGELGDERPVADLPVGVVGRGPRLLGELGDQLGGAGGQGEPDRVGQPAPYQPAHVVVGRAGAVDADQHPASRPPVTSQAGELGQCLAGDGDVVGGGVGPGVARPQQHRQRLAGAGRTRGRRTPTADDGHSRA